MYSDECKGPCNSATCECPPRPAHVPPSGARTAPHHPITDRFHNPQPGDRAAQPAYHTPVTAADVVQHCTQAKPAVTLHDGHVWAGHRRKLISEVTREDLSAMASTDVVTVALALQGVLRLKEIDLARANESAARAERNYWSNRLEQCARAVKKAEAINRGEDGQA